MYIFYEIHRIRINFSCLPTCINLWPTVYLTVCFVEHKWKKTAICELITEASDALLSEFYSDLNEQDGKTTLVHNFLRRKPLTNASNMNFPHIIQFFQGALSKSHSSILLLVINCGNWQEPPISYVCPFPDSSMVAISVQVGARGASKGTAEPESVINKT